MNANDNQVKVEQHDVVIHAIHAIPNAQVLNQVKSEQHDDDSHAVLNAQASDTPCVFQDYSNAATQPQEHLRSYACHVTTTASISPPIHLASAPVSTPAAPTTPAPTNQASATTTYPASTVDAGKNDTTANLRANNFTLQHDISQLERQMTYLRHTNGDLAGSLRQVQNDMEVLRAREHELADLTAKQAKHLQVSTEEGWWNAMQDSFKGAMLDLQSSRERACEMEEMREAESKECVKLEERVSDLTKVLGQIERVVSVFQATEPVDTIMHSPSPSPSPSRPSSRSSSLYTTTGM